MIFLLETVAFLQLVLIPGTLVIGLVRPNYGKFRSLLLIPGLSLLVNYIYAAAALSCGIFTWWSARIFTVLTWVLICLVFRREIKGFFTGNIWKPFQEYFTSAGNNIRQMYLEMERPGKVLLSVSLFSCAMGLIWFLVELLECRGKVFTTWDSALSWNYWATFWMRQEIPRNLSYYPQMIPLNWANAYLIIGRELQFVTKFAVMFFPLLAGLFFADYGLRKRSIPMLLSVPLLAVFFVNVDFQSHGAELDTVIIYCSTALLFTVYYLKDAGNKQDFYRQLLVIALLLAVAGSVKQAGLFLIPAAILIGGTAINQKRKELEGIMHPLILNKLNARKDDPLFAEVPLLFESGWDAYFDHNILICSDEKILIRRLIERGLKEEEIKARLSAQMSVEEKRKRADILISNNGSLEDLYRAIDECLKVILC